MSDEELLVWAAGLPAHSLRVLAWFMSRRVPEESELPLLEKSLGMELVDRPTDEHGPYWRQTPRLAALQPQLRNLWFSLTALEGRPHRP
jgi:hypothetical protein